MASKDAEPEHLRLHAEPTSSQRCHGSRGEKEPSEKNSPCRELLSRQPPWPSQAALATSAGREAAEALLPRQAPLCRVEVLLLPTGGSLGEGPCLPDDSELGAGDRCQGQCSTCRPLFKFKGH